LCSVKVTRSFNGKPQATASFCALFLIFSTRQHVESMICSSPCSVLIQSQPAASARDLLLKTRQQLSLTDRSVDLITTRSVSEGLLSKNAANLIPH
jgi:hypothetical protein